MYANVPKRIKNTNNNQNSSLLRWVTLGFRINREQPKLETVPVLGPVASIRNYNDATAPQPILWTSWQDRQKVQKRCQTNPQKLSKQESLDSCINQEVSSEGRAWKSCRARPRPRAPEECARLALIPLSPSKYGQLQQGIQDPELFNQLSTLYRGAEPLQGVLQAMKC